MRSIETKWKLAKNVNHLLLQVEITKFQYIPMAFKPITLIKKLREIQNRDSPNYVLIKLA